MIKFRVCLLWRLWASSYAQSAHSYKQNTAELFSAAVLGVVNINVKDSSSAKSSKKFAQY